MRICRGREDTSHELRETRWEKPQKHHVGLVGWLGQPSWPISNQRCLSAWLSSEEKVPRRHHEEVQSRTFALSVILSFFLDIGRHVHFVTIIFMVLLRFSVFLFLGNQELVCFARDAFLLQNHPLTVESRLLVY